MNANRRQFLKGTFWMGAAATLAGCSTGALKISKNGGSMQGFAVPPLKKVRVGVIGLGRGFGGAMRMSQIPGTEVTAICDLVPARINRMLEWFKENGKKAPKVYTGSEEAWKKLCDSDDVDLVYNATPWQLHAPIAVYAMKSGKHAAVEVPAALTLDECWEVVETAEKTRRHCMQLENCCYGETELLALNLARKGLLGDLIHGEAAYIHDLRGYCYGKFDKEKGSGGYWNYWRLKYNKDHAGNQYETHGLGPICQYMNINRGDRFDYLVSVDSKQLSFEKYAKAKFGPDSWQGKMKVRMGNMNTTVIKTVLGRTIMVQHDVASPRPYSRINLISGTKGILCDYPFRVALAKDETGSCHFFDAEEGKKIRKEHMHPLWAQAGELAKKVGGHGGMDFLMDLRLSYCLQNGLPLDMDVYDLASWCSLGELTEKSSLNRGCTIDVPDFTKGGWMTAKPLGIETIDLKKLNLNTVIADKNAMNV